MNSSPPPVPQPSRASGRAVASLVLGILSLVLALGCVGMVPGLIGAVLGGLGRRDPHSRTMANWGLGLSLAGTVLSLVMVASLGWLVREARSLNFTQSGPDLSEWEGVQAPDFTITTLDGKELKLSDLRGKRVVLDFWATWCPPCVKEIPHFVQLYSETSRDQLEIVGISDEETSVIEAFAQKMKIPYILGAAKELPAPFDDVSSLPTTFFIDRRGVIQSIAVGYHDLASLREKALAPDTTGEPKAAPAPPKSGLEEPTVAREPVPVWTNSLPAAAHVTRGDWDGDGVEEVLVTGGEELRRVSWDGVTSGSQKWPSRLPLVELGKTQSGEPRILGYANWGKGVHVLDRTGKELWKYASKEGVNGAHWGDLDGDGADELVLGQNGDGGLQVLDITGKLQWQLNQFGNVWNQAVVPAREDQPGRVLFTEAGGLVHVYDAKGQEVDQFELDGNYCAAMTAAWMGPTNGLQVIGEAGDDFIVAADASGTVAWRLEADANSVSWREPQFTPGDLDGDGEREWVLREGNNLVVATPRGVRLATLELESEPTSFTVISPRTGPGRLVVLQDDGLVAYELR
jgi:peroxiredoxin